jgi:hypothetical protein
MARTKISVTHIGLSDSTAFSPVIMAQDSTGESGYYIDGITRDDRVSINVNFPGGTGMVRILSGDYDNAGVGNLDVSGDEDDNVIGPLEGMRFRTSDGHINVDNLGVTGIISAIQLG